MSTQRSTEFLALLEGLRLQGPHGAAAHRLASTFLPEALAGIYPQLEPAHVLNTAWLALHENLFEKNETTTPKLITLTWLVEMVRHKLKNEISSGHHGASEDDIREGRWKKNRGSSGIRLFRAGSTCEWEDLLREFALRNWESVLCVSPSPGETVFDEYENLLWTLGWDTETAIEVVELFEERTGRDLFTRGEILEELREIGISKASREAMYSLAAATDGYVVPRLLGQSPSTVWDDLTQSPYIDALQLRSPA